MPARDIYHDAVVHVLIADGWTITDDPLHLSYGGREFYVDIGAERGPIAAEKEGRRIAVEIQSFLSPSEVRDLQEAIGQLAVYRTILAEDDPDRVLYLAVSRSTFEGIFSERLGQLVIATIPLRLLVFDEKREKVVQWIN